MGNYTYSFSTGTEIDTFEVSGYCLDAENLEPIKGMMVGLYAVDSLNAWEDSVFHKEPFLRVSRTNGSGRFTIKGVAPGQYYCYALDDTDGDFVYAQKGERIGYSHSIVTPSSKPDTRQDTIWADSLHIASVMPVGYTHFLPDDVTLLCFQAPQTDRFLLKTERKEPEKIGFFFSYGNDSLPRLRGMNFDSDSAFVLEPSMKGDTVYYWLRDTALINQDTLRMEATYLMTDSTGLLIEKTDTIEALAKVPYAKRMKEQAKKLEEWQKEQEKKKKRDLPYDSVMPPEWLKLKFTNAGHMAPNQTITFTTPVPLEVFDTAAVHLYIKIDTLWYEAPREIVQLSTRTYQLVGDWQANTEYSLEIDSAAARTIYGLTNKAIKEGIKVQGNDEFSSLLVNISGAGADTATVIVQLMDGSDKVVRQEKVVDGTAEFSYLKPGKYYLRAFIDRNGNDIWDTGDYDQDLQAEPVFYHNEELECKVKWDVTRDWRLDGLPRFRQKPLKITKQKPDKEKQLKNRNLKRAADKGIEYIPKGQMNIVK